MARGKYGLGNVPHTARATSSGSNTTSEMLAAAKTNSTEVLVKLGDPDIDAPEGWGPNLFITINSGRRYVSFGLTNQTAAELRALRKALNVGLDTAIEIAIERDEIAEEAQQNGDDSYHRLHRGVPLFLVRSGVEQKHHPCICDGRTTLVLGANQPAQPAGDSAGRGGDGNEAVAEHVPEQVGAAHDDAQGNQPQVVHEVAGDHQPTGELQAPDSSTA